MKTNKEIAAGLRAIARSFERTDRGPKSIHESQYTCDVVDHFDQDAAGAYQNLLVSEADLWWDDEKRAARPLEDRTKIRVLMLCFAAAMAETGDLI